MLLFIFYFILGFLGIVLLDLIANWYLAVKDK